LLAEEGAKVIVNDFGGSAGGEGGDKTPADEVVDMIKSAGGEAAANYGNVADFNEGEKMVQQAIDTFGRLDIVVNNAGVMLLGPINGAPTEEWDRMIDVNLKGLLYTTHAALPYLFKAQEDSPRGVADVVNISSVAGRVATAGAGVYNLTKHGVGAVSEALRQEASRHGVRVTIIEPGFVETELQGHNRPEVHEKLKERIAKVEPLQAHDIADAIEYAVTRPAHVSLNELLIRPTTQP
jgi:NADP-dependent 3-hydroxy acid dehydrogenase YdfG